MAVDTFGFPPGVASHGIEVFEKSDLHTAKFSASAYSDRNHLFGKIE